jgi:hypothetical protein
LRVELLLALDERRNAEVAASQLWRDGYREPGFVSLLRARAIAIPALALMPEAH